MISSFRQFVFGTIALAVIAVPERTLASASGNVSGYVRDQETGQALPGASIIVEGTTFGAMADKYGFYIIYNLPVGSYNLRAIMIGYVPMKVTNVQVKTDLNTPVSFSLSSQALKVQQEIVITAPRIKIYKDVTSSVHYIGEQELSYTLPAQNFQDALPLVPGFVANHFRGGRSSNVLYLIDGLPANGPLTRDLAFMVQNTAITEMVVQTGGFNPEYGNVSAGLVNIITKEGRNEFHGMAKVATDVLGRYERRFDNNRRAEFTIGGPLILGLGGPVIETHYLLSGGINLSDTPYRKELRQSFTSPVFFNYDLNAKLTIQASRNLHLRGQALVADWDWRQYNAQWNDRTSALPKRRNRHLRASLSLIHTLSPKMFYNLDLTGMELRRNVFGDVSTTQPTNLAVANQSVASVWPGAKEPWYEQNVEKQLTAHLSLLRQFHPAHHVKFGIETNVWDLAVDRVRYLLWPTRPKSTSSFVYSCYNDSFRQFPMTAAAYVHHKVEWKNLLVNWGVRYELFSANARETLLPVSVASDELTNISTGSKSRLKQTVAPRLSIAIPVGNIEHLSLNYGWFYELPPLYYFYLNRAGNQEAYWPLFGNVDLKPLRSTAWEVTYRRVVSPQSIYSLTYFYRQYEDLLDTSPYAVPVGARESDPKTILRYENHATARTSGLEMAIKRDFGRGFNGAFLYTYLQSVGTASWPESNLLRLAHGDEGNRTSPLSLAWDQHHTFTLNLGYMSRRGLLVNMLAKINSPAMATDWLSGAQNQLPVRNDLDVKVSAPVRWAGLRFEPFVEIRNLLDGRYTTPGQGGMDLSQPTSPFGNESERRIWVGILYR